MLVIHLHHPVTNQYYINAQNESQNALIIDVIQLRNTETDIKWSLPYGTAPGIECKFRAYSDPTKQQMHLYMQRIGLIASPETSSRASQGLLYMSTVTYTLLTKIIENNKHSENADISTSLTFDIEL